MPMPSDDSCLCDFWENSLFKRCKVSTVAKKSGKRNLVVQCPPPSRRAPTNDQEAFWGQPSTSQPTSYVFGDQLCFSSSCPIIFTKIEKRPSSGCMNTWFRFHFGIWRWSWNQQSFLCFELLLSDDPKKWKLTKALWWQPKISESFWLWRFCWLQQSSSSFYRVRSWMDDSGWPGWRWKNRQCTRSNFRLNLTSWRMAAMCRTLSLGETPTSTPCSPSWRGQTSWRCRPTSPQMADLWVWALTSIFKSWIRQGLWVPHW